MVKCHKCLGFVPWYEVRGKLFGKNYCLMCFLENEYLKSLDKVRYWKKEYLFEKLKKNRQNDN